MFFTMATLFDVLEVAGCSRDDFNNWRRRDVLQTTIRETSPGGSLILNKSNALEISFVSALVKAGASPNAAAAYARTLMAHCRQGTLRKWLVFANGNPATSKASDRPQIDDLQKQFGASTLTFVCVADIANKVDALFDKI